jgi:hypothetical protein
MPLSVPEQIAQLETAVADLTQRILAIEALVPGIDRLMDRLPTWDGPPPQPPEPS